MPISREYLEKNKNRHNRIAADGVTIIPATEGSRAIPTEYIGYLPTSAPKEVTREDLDGPADGVSPQQADILFHLTDEQLGIYTIDQMAEWVEAHPFVWIIDNLLRKSTFNVIAAEPKAGKAVCLHTPMLTRDGWVKFGDLKVGDEVHTHDGSLTRIVAVSPVMHNHKCYRVTTRSGASLIADAEHLWQVSVRNHVAIVTTEELKKGHNGRRWLLPVPAPLQRPEIDLPIDPYILGYWLGNGESKGGGISINNADADTVLAEVVRAGYEHKVPVRWPGYVETRLYGLKAQIKALGLYANKHIPTTYMTASIHQRRELLAGLLDSDGYAATAPNGSGSVEFCSINKRLAEQTLELVRSLGMKARIAEGRATLNGRDCGPKYRVTFAASRQKSPFKSPRRTNALPDRPLSQRSWVDAVVSVEEVDSVPVRCIKVADNSGLFVAGRDFVVTHNTTLLNTLALCVAGSGTDDFVGRKVLLNGPVVYYNLETQPNDFNDLVKSYDRPPHDLLMIPSFPQAFADTGIPAVEHVRHILARKKPLMVLIDMYWNIDGVQDENAYGQVYKSLWGLKAMVEKQFTDSCMVITLHTRKPPNRQRGQGQSSELDTRDTADILGSQAFRGVPHSMIMLNKNPNTDIRYVHSSARDGINLPNTPLRKLESGLIVSDDRLIQPHHDEMDVTESRKAQFIMAVHRYCVDHQKPAVSFDCVCSWSGLHRSQYTPACKIAIDDGYIVCSGGKDNKGLVGVSRHPILYSIAPNVHLPAAWYALQLPKDAFATQGAFATQKEKD